MGTTTEQDSTILRKTIIYLIGNFSSKILGTLIIPIYAVYLSAAELGNYDFQMSVGNFLSPIIVLAIWESILRYGLGKKKENLKEVISTGLAIAFVSASSFFAVLLFAYLGIYGLNELTIMYALMIGLVPVVTVFQYISRTTENNVVYVQASIFSSIINLLSLIIFVVIMKNGLKGLTISTILTSFSTILFISFKIKLRNYIAFSSISRNLFFSMIKYSLPLIFNLAFIWFVNGFSRFYITLSLGATANGTYAFASKFSLIVASISSVVNMAAIEDAVLNIESPEFINRFEQNTNKIITTMLDLMLVLVPVIGLTYKFISNADYQQSQFLVPILIYAVFLQNSGTLIGNVFNVYNKTNVIFITSMSGAALNVGFAIILNGFFGLTGIVIAQLVGGLGIFMSRYIIGKKIINYKILWRRVILLTVVFILANLIIYYDNPVIMVIQSLVIFIYILVKYRFFIMKTVFFFLDRLKNK